VWGTKEVSTGFWWEAQGKERVQYRNFKKWDGGARNGFLWLRIGTYGVFL